MGLGLGISFLFFGDGKDKSTKSQTAPLFLPYSNPNMFETILAFTLTNIRNFNCSNKMIR